MKKIFISIFVFSFSIYIFGFFNINNLSLKVEAGVNGETITEANIKPTSVSVLFTSTSNINPPYTLDLINVDQAYVSKNQSKTLSYDQINFTNKYLATVDFNNLSPGFSYKVQLSDAASSVIEVIDFKTTIATVTGFAPKTGKFGDFITITGTMLDSVDSVMFGSTPVNFTDIGMIDSNTITVIVPRYAIDGKITVKTKSSGNATSLDTFKVISVPSSVILTVNNITNTTATLVASGNLNQQLYDFYIYDSIVYGNRGSKGLTEINSIAHISRDVGSSPVSGISAAFEGLKLSPGVIYIALVDYKLGENETNPTYEFKLPIDTTAGKESLNTSNITSSTVDIVATGLSDSSTYQIQIVNDSVKSPTPKYDNINNITVVNGVATASFTNLTAGNSYIAGIIKNNDTNSLMARITFVAKATPTSTSTTTTTNTFSGIVPVCNTGAINKDTGQYEIPCDFVFFMKLLNSIIRFLLFIIATPLIALIIMYTGYLYITAGGNSGQTEKVRHILFNVVIGYIIALSAWLIINTIISSLKVDPDINTFLEKSTLVK